MPRSFPSHLWAFRIGLLIAGVGLIGEWRPVHAQDSVTSAVGQTIPSVAALPPAPPSSGPQSIGPHPAGLIAPVRATTLALDYRMAGVGSDAEVELWYTRDRSASWQRYGVDPDRTSPFIATLPAQGLYGLTLIVHTHGRSSAPPPIAQQPPQRWVFVDDTPPLAQWQSVEPLEDFGHLRRVQLAWTAHDDHLPADPIGLAYQSSVDQQWRTIEPALANVGRYDWTVPAELTGQVTLRLTVRDRGRHVVERLFGPVAVAYWEQTSPAAAVVDAGTEGAAHAESGLPGAAHAVISASPAPSTAPAGVPASRPASEGIGSEGSVTAAPAGEGVGVVERRRAEELYKQASWHLVRGQYPLAAERLRETLQWNPGMIQALNDLAGIHYLQKEYEQAIGLYDQVLRIDARHPQALRGAALAYVAQRDYAKSRDMLQQLLSGNDRDAEALLDLGDVLFMMGDRAGARRHWEQVRTAEGALPSIVEKANRRLELYGPGGGDEAVAHR